MAKAPEYIAPAQLASLDVQAIVQHPSLVSHTSALGKLQISARVLLERGITSEETCNAADLTVAAATSAKNAIAAFFAPFCDMANKLHKSLTSKRADMIEPFDAIIAPLKGAQARFLMEKKRKEAEAAEALRRESEQQTKLAEKQADELERRGDFKTADALRQMASNMPTLAPEPAKPTLLHSRVTEKWVGTVTDSMAVIKAIAENKVQLMQEVTIRGTKETRPLVIVDQVVLNAMVSTRGNSLNIPGIKVEEALGIASKGIR